jgi:hypothetical protein
MADKERAQQVIEKYTHNLEQQIEVAERAWRILEQHGAEPSPRRPLHMRESSSFVKETKPVRVEMANGDWWFLKLSGSYDYKAGYEDSDPNTMYMYIGDNDLSERYRLLYKIDIDHPDTIFFRVQIGPDQNTLEDVISVLDAIEKGLQEKATPEAPVPTAG